MNAIRSMKTGAVLAAASMLLAACASTGMGGGEWVRKGKVDEPVLFTWTSDDGGISGNMVATLPDATYRGRFFQITQQTRREVLSPLWDGWDEGWRTWPYWGYGAYGPVTTTQFITHYSGKVVANLRTDDGKRMRCRLHMAHPAQGMAGGGEGECERQGGGVIHAKF